METLRVFCDVRNPGRLWASPDLDRESFYRHTDIWHKKQDNNFLSFIILFHNGVILYGIRNRNNSEAQRPNHGSEEKTATKGTVSFSLEVKVIILCRTETM